MPDGVVSDMQSRCSSGAVMAREDGHHARVPFLVQTDELGSRGVKARNFLAHDPA